MMRSKCARLLITIFTISIHLIVSEPRTQIKTYVDQFTRNHCYYRRVSICYYENLPKGAGNISNLHILEDCKSQFNGNLTQCTTENIDCDNSCEEILQTFVEKPSNLRKFYGMWSWTANRTSKLSWEASTNRRALYLFQIGIRYKDAMEPLDDTVLITNLNNVTYRIPPFCESCQIIVYTILNGSISDMALTDCAAHPLANPRFVEHRLNLLHDKTLLHKAIIRTDLMPTMEFRPDDTIDAFTLIPYGENFYIVAASESKTISAFNDAVSDKLENECPLYYFFTKLSKTNQCQEQLAIYKLTRLNMPEIPGNSQEVCKDYARKILATTISPIGIPRLVLRHGDILYFFPSNYNLSLLEGMPIADVVANHSDILSAYNIIYEDTISPTVELPQGLLDTNFVWYGFTGVSLILSILIAICMIVRRRNKRKPSRGFFYNVKNLESYKKSENRNLNVHYHDFGVKIDEWEVQRGHLELNQDDKLGSGNFGNVFKGYLTKTTEIWNKMAPQEAKRFDNGRMTVAVKMLHLHSTAKEATNFSDEINLMKSLGYHERLVNMIGCIMANQPLCLIVEYCSGGDLHKFLRQKHDYMVEKQMANVMIDPEFICLDTLLTFAWQVACGMEYLSDKGFVHRDLAARNVLLDDDRNVKICDFGLCRTYNNDNLYYTSRGGRLPIKWMALESISEFKFTTASDVWSFGVLLFELVTLARSPYDGVDPHCIEEYLRRGKRMDKPLNCPDELYDLMLQSWDEDPSKRPSFTNLKLRIQQMIVETVTTDYNYLSLMNESSHYCNVDASKVYSD